MDSHWNTMPNATLILPCMQIGGRLSSVYIRSLTCNRFMLMLIPALILAVITNVLRYSKRLFITESPPKHSLRAETLKPQELWKFTLAEIEIKASPNAKLRHER